MSRLTKDNTGCRVDVRARELHDGEEEVAVEEAGDMTCLAPPVNRVMMSIGQKTPRAEGGGQEEHRNEQPDGVEGEADVVVVANHWRPCRHKGCTGEHGRIASLRVLQDVLQAIRVGLQTKTKMFVNTMNIINIGRDFLICFNHWKNIVPSKASFT